MASSNKQQKKVKGNLGTLLTVFETLLGIGIYSKVNVYLKIYVTTILQSEEPKLRTLAIPNTSDGVEEKLCLLRLFTMKKVELHEDCLAVS